MTTPIAEFLKALYPGDEDVMVRLRSQLQIVAMSPGLSSVLLHGPPGTGKTTMARALAMARMIAMVDPSQHRRSLDVAVRDVRSSAALRWYRDISLAGLVESLSDSQLFGICVKTASGVAPRIGLFEQAMTGSTNPNTSDSHKKLIEECKSPECLLTGGVVLLDEIGDLDSTIQAKLLRVLNGEVQYRVGGEGREAFGFRFHGLVILATWRDITDDAIRPDLRQRITQSLIEVPSLSDYPPATRRLILTGTLEDTRRRITEELERLSDADDQFEQLAALPARREELLRWSKSQISAADVRRLADVDWATHGQFRGLRSVLQAVLTGVALDEALRRVRQGNRGSAPSGGALGDRRVTEADPVLVDLDRCLAGKSSVSAFWKTQRGEWAEALHERLLDHDPATLDILTKHGVDRETLIKDLRNARRSKPSG